MHLQGVLWHESGIGGGASSANPVVFKSLFLTHLDLCPGSTNTSDVVVRKTRRKRVCGNINVWMATGDSLGCDRCYINKDTFELKWSSMGQLE